MKRRTLIGLAGSALVLAACGAAAPAISTPAQGATQGATPTTAVAAIAAASATPVREVTEPTSAATTAEAATDVPATLEPTVEPAVEPTAEPTAVPPTETPVPAPTDTPVLPTATAEAAVTKVYKIGDTVELEGVAVTLVSSDVTDGVLHAVMQLTNTSEEEMNVSSILSFIAKTSAGEKLRTAFESGTTGSLDGKILAGDKLKGTLAFTVPTGAEGLKLIYLTNMFTAEQAAVFALDEIALADPFPTPPELTAPKDFEKGTVYKVGEAVRLNGIAIALIEAPIEGKVLKTRFVLQNQSSKPILISSMASFTAKDADGVKGEFKFSMDEPQLEGSLVAGDSLRGVNTYEFASAPSGVKVYFASNIFGGETFVWAVS